MSFQDKLIQCVTCGMNFTFGAGEQKFYASKGLTKEPRHCPQCRQDKKQQLRSPSGSWVSYANKVMMSREYQQTH